MTDDWKQSAGGLYLPVPPLPPPPVPEPVPDVKFRPPLPAERHAGVLRNTFEGYITAMHGRPCPWCYEPIEQDVRHETMCIFHCECGWRVRVDSDGTMRALDRESGLSVRFKVRERDGHTRSRFTNFSSAAAVFTASSPH